MTRPPRQPNTIWPKIASVADCTTELSKLGFVHDESGKQWKHPCGETVADETIDWLVDRWPRPPFDILRTLLDQAEDMVRHRTGATDAA